MLRIKIHSWLLSSVLGLVFLLPVAQAATDCAAVTEIPTMECEALVALYNSTDGANWSNKTGWNLTNTPCSTPWYGVECAGGHVTRLYLHYNQLSGTLAPEIGNLEHLVVLRLENNDICGPVPESWMNLVSPPLYYIDLNYNHLTASAPVKQWLEDNGPWDESTQTPGECTTTGFSCAAVTGIPTTECQALVSIYNESTNGEQWNDNTDWLETNTPCSWHGVECGGGHVTRLYLYYNNLTHALSSQFDKLTMLQVLRVEHNELCGEIPSSLMNLEHLWYLNVNNNHLTATDLALRDWLNGITPGWELTQTPCPGLGTLQFSLSAYSTNEDGVQAVITVTRTGDSSGAASVDYATTDDSATAGSDYTATIGTLNWADMDTVNKTFTVDINDDADLEGDETFVVSLGNPVGAELGGPDTAMVTIMDNEMPFCATVTGIDESECEGLVAIYNSTNGDQWNDNTDWTVTTTPCDWFGVTCGGGHVTRLYLWYNNLSGTIPAEIDNLVNADVINFSHNEICGEVPSSVMSLENPPMWYMNVNYNHLTASNPVKAWLNDISPGWSDTQTDCP